MTDKALGQTINGPTPERQTRMNAIEEKLNHLRALSSHLGEQASDINRVFFDNCPEAEPLLKDEDVSGYFDRIDNALNSLGQNMSHLEQQLVFTKQNY